MDKTKVQRAYGVLDLKSLNEEERIIEGIASTPTPDRMGDIVEPLGAKFTLPMPLLWQHDSAQPIGHVEFAKASESGIKFRAKIAKIADPGNLRDRIEEAWQTIKAGLVRGVSIGFRALEYSFMESGGIKFIEWEWLELSAVTVPANAEASIQNIKSLDSALLAATGRKPSAVVRLSDPGVSGKSSKPKTAQGGPTSMKPIQDQIKEWEAKRQAKAGAMESIMTKAADEGRTLNAEEGEQHDTLTQEVGEIDKHLARLNDMQKSMVKAAKPINTITDADAGSRARAEGTPGVQVLEPALEKGVGFARIIRCMAFAEATKSNVADVAKLLYPNYQPVLEVSKALFAIKAVNAATGADSTWAGPLVQYQILASEFINWLRPQTIIGKFGTGNIPSLRRVPFKVKVPRQTSAGSGYWVGEGKPKPLTSWALDTVSLDYMKVASIAVITDELARFSSPSAELLVRDELAAAIIQRADIDFIDPSNSGTANVKPASISNGVTAITSGGDTADYVRQDVANVLAPMIQANMPTGGTVWVMNENTAVALELMTTTLGIQQFPGITANGGVFIGRPVIVSQYVPSADVFLVAASEIMLADDGNVTVDVSREASLEMLSGSLTQDATNGTGASLVSMFQTNSLAVKAEREIAWAKRRSQAVQYITSANWGGGANSGDV